MVTVLSVLVGSVKYQGCAKITFNSIKSGIGVFLKFQILNNFCDEKIFTSNLIEDEGSVISR